MKIRFTQWIGVFAFLLIGNMAVAQSQTPLDIALRHIEENYKTWNLTQSDIQDMVVSDMYTSKKTGTTRIYFNQSHNGIKLQNAIINVSVLDNGNVNFVGKNFTPNLESKIFASSANINSDQAMQVVLNDLGINSDLPRATEVSEGTKYIYEGSSVSNYKTISELLYKNLNDELQLVWNIQYAPIGTSEKWEYSVDANSSQVLQKKDMVLRCAFDDSPFHNHDAHCSDYNHAGKTPTVEEALTMTSAMTGSYRVFPFGTMAPNDGMHTLVTDPDDATASPFGWHDTDGMAGPEFTFTQGNNVHAFLDRDDDDTPDSAEPDGGMSLAFDFPFNPSLEAIDNADAATVNLFYFSNIVHDFTYGYGFDEASGNYQVNNYGNGGFGNDGLVARAQAAADAGSTNNAFFTPSPDGVVGTVNMFVWDDEAAITGNLNVTAPASIAGQYNTGAADYGPPVSDVPVSGEVVEINDNIFNPYVTDGCEEFVNAAEVAGKIALVDRGGCFFEQKSANAEAAGAIAIIICNFEDDPMGMAGVPEIDDPTIPTISIGAIACQTIRQFAGNGLEVEIVLPAAGIGPDFLDGDFDNGIIAHEIGHGISSRLVGGPSNVCLGNEEQMGEGWSDYFGLIASVKPTDNGAMRRGVGTYVQRQDTDATGIRTYPYSTDMGVNPHTYADINTESVPHGVGSVWCAIIWDLYWRMVDEYGFDEDQYHGDGGNNRAIWLVMDGMKNLACSPGFVSGRDAILAADMDLYGGANQCLIWEVFARRGVGFYADEGSTASRSDQTESFEVRPTCVEELKIAKTVTPLIEAGDDIDITINVINHKPETLTGVTVTDMIPDGTAYIDGSASIPAADVTVTGNMITFALGAMDYEDEINLTYQLLSDESNFSIINFYDDMEDIDDNFWFPIAITQDATNFWTPSMDNPNSGENAWFVLNDEGESQQILQGGQPSNKITVTGDNPVLRFYHAFNTESGADGGVVEISTDDGVFWNQLGDQMFRGGYSGFIQYATFTVPNFSTFYGDSEGYIATYVDLTDYVGQEVILRWNFASDDNTAPENGGWYVDDVELMDMINYNSEACVTSDQGDQACDTAESRGTVVESQLPTGFNDPIDPNVSISVFPNPTDDQINLSISTADNQNVTLSIMTLDGREVIARNIETSAMTQTFTMNVSALPAGFYFVKASTNNGIKVEKVVIH